MRHGRSLAMALAVSILAPLPLLAQAGGQGGQGRGGMGGAMSARMLVEQGSVEYLVTKAADLALTPDQTKQLQAIGTAWADATKEQRSEIKAMLPEPGQGMGGGDRQAMMERMQRMRPLAQKLAEDDSKALDEALALLDETQKTKAATLLEERRQNARPRRGGGA